MLSKQIQLVRQTRRRKTILWKNNLDCRLLSQSSPKALWDTAFYALAAVSAAFSAVIPLISIPLSLIPEVVADLSCNLEPIAAVAPLLTFALEFSFLFGVLSGMYLP